MRSSFKNYPNDLDPSASQGEQITAAIASQREHLDTVLVYNN